MDRRKFIIAGAAVAVAPVLPAADTVDVAGSLTAYFSEPPPRTLRVYCRELRLGRDVPLDQPAREMQFDAVGMVGVTVGSVIEHSCTEDDVTVFSYWRVQRIEMDPFSWDDVRRYQK